MKYPSITHEYSECISTCWDLEKIYIPVYNIDKDYTSFDAFKEQFTNSAINNFGSGWTWLVKKADGSVAIENTSNAATPLTDASVTPILTVDVWEHAYYVDHRNARPKYMNAFWALVNWDFVNQNFA